MQHPIHSIANWIRQPDFKDADKNQSALYLQMISLAIILASAIIIITYAIAGQHGYTLLVGASNIVCGVVILLVRYKKIRFASNLFLISTLCLLTMGIFSGGGIHSSSSMIYPLLFIFASLLLNRRAFIVYSLLGVASVGLIVFAEHQKLSPAYIPDPAEFPLFLTVSLIIASSALFIRFITESMQTNLLRTQLAMQELATQKTMLDHVGQAVVGCRTDDTIVYWNQASTKLYGWQAEEALGRKYLEILPAKMTRELGAYIRETLREGNVWSGELEIQKRDQSLLPVLGTIAPILDDQNQLDGWIGIATDISKRKESEQTAKRRAEEMSFLYQFGISVASGIDLYTTLLTLRTEISKLIKTEAFYVAIYNIETGIVSYPIFFEEGKPIQEADRILSENPGFTGAVIFNKKTLYLPDMLTREVEEIYHPYNTNGSTLRTFLGIPLVAGERVIGMISVQSKDVDAYQEDQVQLMETLAVQAAIAIDKARLLDQIQQELAERKRTEAALTFSEGKFYKAFHTTPVLMSIENEENRFIDVNKAFMDTIGYEREDVIGRRASDLQMWGSAEDMQAVKEKLKEGNNLKDLEIRYRRNTGEVGYVLMSSEKFDVNGTSYTLTSALDITERKRVEADLQRELEERKRITADLLQRESILDAVAFAAELLLKSPNWRDEINMILERLGKCITASHAYLFQNLKLDNGLLATTIIFEWTAPGYSDDLTNPKYINAILTEDDLASWYTTMQEGLIYVGDTSHLSIEDMQYLRERDILAMLDLPIIINGEWWGTMGFDDMENEREWTSAEMDALRAAANVLGAAIQRQITDVVIKDELIQRRKLINELEQKNAESETLRETTVIVASTLNSSESVQRILEQLKHVISYDSASVWLYKKNTAVMVGWNGLSAEALAPGSYVLSESEPDYPLRAENVRYILLEDIQETYPQFRTHGLEYIHGWLAVPLRARGQLTGFISLDGSDPGQFTRHDAELALTYGNQVAIALENAHLFTELQEELKVSASLIEELESKNAELERFTYTVSHDLKSPLITIRGFLGFIEQDTASGNMERLKVDIKRISDATEKMQRLLQELLQLSRIGRMKNEPTRIPFEELAREAVEITQGQILKRNITVNIQKNLPMILGDRPRIVEVLQNLVDNAAKFMGNQLNPVVEIGLHGEEDGKAVFFVRDNGVGIAPNFYERVFGLFDKLDANSEGTGVGLAIVKRIIEVHGGRIWVESEFGKGSTFFFSLARGD